MRTVIACFVALVVVMFASSSYVACADEPASKPAVYTWHDYYRQQLAINRETLPSAYQRVGKHGAWDAAAVRFLDRVAYYLTYMPARPLYQPNDVPSAASLVADGEAVMKAGCTDPLVRWCYGDVLGDAGRHDDGVAHMRETVPALDPAGYDSLRVWFAAKRLILLDPTPDTVAQFKPLLITSGVKMASGKLDDGRRRLVFDFLWSHLSGLAAAERLDFLKELHARPDADPWVSLVLQGYVDVQIAWEFRGDGWANTVTDAGWRGFYDHLTKAQHSLTQAHALAPHLPDAAVQMIRVAMGAGDRLGEDPMTWFNRAIAAQLDSREAYDAIIFALEPRWGGNHEAMFDIGMRAVRTERYDIEGPWQLVRAVDMIGIDSGQGWRVLERAGLYDALCEIADRYAAAHVKDGKDARYITFRAALAWSQKRYKEARRYLDKVGDRVVPDAFKVVACADPPMSISYIYAVTSPQGEAVTEAETAFAAERYDGMLAALKTAQAAPDLHPRGKMYVDARIGHAEFLTKLAKGEWIDLQPPAENLGAWRKYSRGGRWNAEPDRALTGVAAEEFRTTVYYDVAMGPRVEFIGTVQTIGVGHPTPGISFTQQGHPAIYASFMQAGAGLEVGNQRQELPTDVIFNANGGPLPFRWIYDRGTISLQIAGEDVIVKRELPNVNMQSAYIGLHVAFGGVKFTNMKARRIVDAPAAAPAAPAAVAPEKP